MVGYALTCIVSVCRILPSHLGEKIIFCPYCNKSPKCRALLSSLGCLVANHMHYTLFITHFSPQWGPQGTYTPLLHFTIKTSLWNSLKLRMCDWAKDLQASFRGRMRIWTWVYQILVHHCNCRPSLELVWLICPERLHTGTSPGLNMMTSIILLLSV